MKLCYTSTTLMILRLRLMVKMSYQKLFRTAASSVITYLEDKDIDILIFDESHRMGAKTVREKWDPIVSYCIKQGIKVVGGTATDVRAERGKLRDSDYVPEYDPTNNSTYQQRLADKYNNNLR